MTIWTLEQILTARGLRASTRVDQEVLIHAHNPKEIVEYATLRTINRLVEDAQTYGLDLWVADLHIETHETHDSEGSPYRPMQTTTASWKPQIRAASLVGGPGDGTLMEVNPFDNLPTPTITTRHARHLKLLHALGSPPHPIEPVEADTITYQLTGWNNGLRHWIYTPRV